MSQNQATWPSLNRPRLIAALGSSFAAGPGIEPIDDQVAMRSARNYAHLFADRVGADLVDLTVSGASTSNVVDTPQQTMTGQTLPPQIEGVPADADVVTITAGGNDLQFAGAMLYTAWRRHDPNSPLALNLAQMFPGDIPLPTEEDVTRATDGLIRVVEAARSKAPFARILLVDYLTVLDSASTTATPFTDGEVLKFLTIQAAIGRGFADAARRTGADLILASAISLGHALGATEPWIQPFQDDLARTAGSFHPNEDGMAAIAAELERVVLS